MQINLQQKNNRQKGQTLIETLVAAFILTMGVTAALGLATYSLHATSNIKQRIIAIGLAREGVEAVKNMRDTNWLQSTISGTCYNFQSGEFHGAANANCYPNWLNPGTAHSFNISSPGTYFLTYDTSDVKFWQLVASNNFGLNFTTGNPAKGFYQTGSGVPVTSSNSGFGRAITIAIDTTSAPFNQNTGGRMKITTDVWWHDNKCPISNTVPADPSCRITLETYLTNWKTF